VSYSTFVLLSVALPEAAPIVHQGLSIIPAVLFNYFLNSFWTFKDARG
jgi:dolichol-phosphate mannosyltransferase